MVELTFTTEPTRREVVVERLIEVMQCEFPDLDPFVFSTRKDEDA